MHRSIATAIAAVVLLLAGMFVGTQPPLFGR